MKLSVGGMYIVVASCDYVHVQFVDVTLIIIDTHTNVHDDSYGLNGPTKFMHNFRDNVQLVRTPEESVFRVVRS